MSEIKTKVTRIFWQDANIWNTQCPFCRAINTGNNATMIKRCDHLDDADWTFGKAIFKCKDTGIRCPMCLGKFLSSEGIRLKDEQILCLKCGLDIERKTI